MTKLIAWNLLSLDGYFEGDSPWALDFHQSVWGDALEAISRQHAADTGMLLFGRKTHEGMQAYWEQATGDIADFMNRVPKRVASRTLQHVSWHNAAVISGDVVHFVRQAKAQSGGNLYVYGSADLLCTLLAHGLVDEYRLCIAPVVLGSGTPLFKPGQKHAFRLLEARALASGGLVARYDVNCGRVDSAQRLIAAPAETLYAALTDPRAMAQWRPPVGMTGEILEVDARAGGRFRMALHYEDAAQAGKSGEGVDVFESQFVCLTPNREVTEAITFQSSDPAFAGTMTMSTRLLPVGDATEVSLIATGVPSGINQDDHLAGLTSTLDNLARFVQRGLR